MKIGTLTFHRACNYGGVLQCFALVKALKKMGYDAEVVDYRSQAIEDSYTIIKTNGIKNFIASILSFPVTQKSINNFKEFRNKFIPISSNVYHSASELSDKYDLCFIGSDQVWSKRINRGFDSVYWGQFNGRKASYAASMGTDHNYTEAENNQIKSFLANFDNLSTREDSLRDELLSLTDKPIQTVIDPTLLLSREDYEAIAIKPKEDNYVLYYQMEYHPQSKDFVTNIAKQLGCKVITLMGPNENYEGVEHLHKTVPQVKVEEFVGYILNAKCVIASSFHGTALPIAMKKDFYFLANFQADRSENLLRYLGALDRMRTSTDIIAFSHVDYSLLLPRLSSFVQNSKNFINECVAVNISSFNK